MKCDPPIPLARPDIGQREKQLITQVLDSGQLSRGHYLARFEEAAAHTLNTAYAVACSSGTAGLILALKSLGVAAGDKVITVSYTVPATVNAVVAVGARPILIDIDPATRGMSLSALEIALHHHCQVAAVIVVHAFGQAPDMHRIQRLCDDAGIPLIEDACEAFGNYYDGKALGTWGVCGVFGFYPNKQMTTGEGGLLVTNDPAVANQARQLLNNGRVMDGDWLDQKQFGWNFRLDEMSAALGLGQVARVQEMLDKRRTITRYYDAAMSRHVPDWQRPAFSVREAGNAWFAYVVHWPLAYFPGGAAPSPDSFDSASRYSQRILEEMQSRGIQCGRYFAPVHKQPAFVREYGDISLPVTEHLAVTGLALPFYNQLTSQHIECVVSALRQVMEHLCD